MDNGTLIRELQREVLATMLRPEDDERPDSGTVVVLAGVDGQRVWAEVAAPGPDEIRMEHLEREVCALIALHAPLALAVATAVRGVPVPHESIVAWAAERDGETLAMRMHTSLTPDGLLVPGPIGMLVSSEALLAAAWVKALQAAAA